MVTSEESVSKASKGYIETYYSNTTSLNELQFGFGSSPVFDTQKALDMIRKDATVTAAITTLVDKAMENGYKIQALDGKSNLKDFEKVLDKVRFKKLLRQIFYNLFLYGNCFVEIVKDGNGNVKELHVLETTLTEPVADEHGTILGYKQTVIAGRTSDKPDWAPEEITHFVLNKVSTNVWGEIDLQSVYTSVLIKQYIHAFLGWLFGTNQFRGFYNIKNASDVQIKEFLAFLKRSEENIEKPLVAEGEIQYQINRNFNDGESILKLLTKCDEDILSLLQVPPIAVGNASDSNRSNSDAQISALNTRVSSVQEVIEDDCRFDLYVKMGYEKVELSFNPLSKPDVAKMLEIAERMHTMGFKDEVIEEFLKTQDFPISGKLFKSKEELMDMQPIQKKSEDMFPSRQRKQDNEGNDRIGTGVNSTTRDEQVAKGMSFNQTVRSKYNSYPYVYEVKTDG